jgi:RsbRD-like negative regulator of sigma factor
MVSNILLHNNMLNQLLIQHKRTLNKRWLERTTEVYSQHMRKFFAKEGNNFANPVGQSLATNLKKLLDGIIQDDTNTDLSGPLQEIIKIRAVQDLSSAQSVAFVFQLKNIVWDVLSDKLDSKKSQRELDEFNARIEALGFMAFDIYVECHKQIVQIRISELKRSVGSLLRRTKFFDDDLEAQEIVASIKDFSSK